MIGGMRMQNHDQNVDGFMVSAGLLSAALKRCNGEVVGWHYDPVSDIHAIDVRYPDDSVCHCSIDTPYLIRTLKSL